MKLKTVINIEVEKNDIAYVFSMPVGGQYGQAYEAAIEVAKQIAFMAQEAQAAQEEKKWSQDHQQLSKDHQDKE